MNKRSADLKENVYFFNTHLSTIFYKNVTTQCDFRTDRTFQKSIRLQFIYAILLDNDFPQILL